MRANELLNRLYVHKIFGGGVFTYSHPDLFREKQLLRKVCVYTET